MFEPPQITEADASWAASALGLPAGAFSGPDGQDPRLGVMKAMGTLDIEACPGSGKTTLLVAKLAVIARKWTERQRGVCVLSHTNVAREQIENRLGNTAVGQSLLAYPHFIGTIHGFANEFLAMPWLRSQGIPIETIDDEIALEWRWRRLPQWVKDSLAQVGKDEWAPRYISADIDLGEIKWGRGNLGKDTKIHKALRSVCRKSVMAGFHCYDEMFVWAHDLIDNVPEVTNYFRLRFPLIFIDEVQDNSELQSVLLHRIFMEGDNPVVRLRFGDANQAIYRYADQVGAVTDPFPVAEVRRDIPNSFRFGQSIADLTDPLAVEPQGLQGHGGEGPDDEPEMAGRHAIFLFDDETVGGVLGAYAAYLLEEFSEKELREGDFTAIGAVHRPGPADNIPRFVGHYWPEYDSGIARADPQPATFVQYILAGQRLAEISGEAHGLVEKLAQGVLRLTRISNADVRLSGRKRKHRYVLELLEDKAEEKELYIELIRRLGVERMIVTGAGWEELWYPALTAIGVSLAGVAALPAEAEEFLSWAGPAEGNAEPAGKARSDNLFRYPVKEPQIAIRVGSIHSVKGETHTSALVMDTFFRAHHLKTLKPWLLGDKSGGNTKSDAIQKRLKLHYVGMTRPARLLCVAMRGDALTEAEITKLRARGWRVGRVTDAGTEWLA